MKGINLVINAHNVVNNKPTKIWKELHLSGSYLSSDWYTDAIGI
jgi:hypothetical protein